MLSICIPIFNNDVTELVHSLLGQVKHSITPVEIILIDDGSELLFRSVNKKLSENIEVEYIELDQNVGRARIRNLFVKHTKFDYLLFLDADSKIIHEDFVEKYLESFEEKPYVVCGGRIYDTKTPSKLNYLRWEYGIKRESISLDKRELNPYGSFMTNNFLIKAKLLAKIPFDERLTQYGHEDTLFGFELKQNKIPIKHIKNEVLHLFDENNEEFLIKTEMALNNLAEISTRQQNNLFDQEVKILRFYRKIECFGINYILALLNIMTGRMIFKLLKNNRGGVNLFNIYKIMLLSGLIIKKEKNADN